MPAKALTIAFDLDPLMRDSLNAMTEFTGATRIELIRGGLVREMQRLLDQKKQAIRDSYQINDQTKAMLLIEAKRVEDLLNTARRQYAETQED